MQGFRETPTPRSDLQYSFTVFTFLTGTFLFAYVIGRTGDWVSRCGARPPSNVNALTLHRRTARKENLDLRLTIMEQFIESHGIAPDLANDLLEFYR
jgi:hypothetical protein